MPELRRRTSIGLAEGRAEVAVAGEAKVEAQGGEVVILSEKVQRGRQAKAQLVAIQRQAFHQLEDLREIHRLDANFLGDLGQRPPPRRIPCKHERSSVNPAL